MNHMGATAQRLPETVKAYWLVSAGATWCALAAPILAGIIMWQAPIPWWVVPLVLAVILLLEVALVDVRYRHYSYRLDGMELTLTRGRLVQRRVTTAVSQVLHTEVVQGPIQRRYGLVTFKAQQAAGAIELGPIRPDEAERLRQLVVVATSKQAAS